MVKFHVGSLEYSSSNRKLSVTFSSDHIEAVFNEAKNRRVSAGTIVRRAVAAWIDRLEKEVE